VDNLTIVIPYWNGAAAIERLLESLPPDVHVLLVDDQSDAPYQSNRPNVAVIRPGKKGYFAGAVNAGAAACKTDVLVLNQDSWLEGAASLDLIAKERARFAVIGEGVFGHPAWPNGYVQGTFMFMRRDALVRVGGFNQADYPLWGCTCDWQARVCRSGFAALPLKSIPGFHHKDRARGAFGDSITEALRREPGKKSTFIRTPPLVSVIVPCHNYGKFLPDLINSLAGGPTSLGNMPGQTFASWELIVVDDASTDDTAARLHSLANPWQGIRAVYRKVRGGTAAANNTGIAASHGQYITILGADDMMEPSRLERLVRAAEAHPHRMIYDDIQLFKAGKRFQAWNMPEYDFEKLLFKNHVHAGILFPRQAWKETGGYPESMNQGREDWAFNVALGAWGYCGVHVGYPGYLYRREGHNRSLTNAGRDWHNRFLDQLKAIFPKLYAGERPMACCGGGRSPAKKSNGGGSGLPGQSGFVRIEYIGQNAGDMPWYGIATGTRYTFGGVHRFGYVDPRDARSGSAKRPGFLELIEGRKPVFREAPLPIPAKAVPMPASAPAPAAAILEAAEAVEAELEAGELPGVESDAESALALEILAGIQEKARQELADPETKPKRSRKKKADGD
jgi:glycosyltransferase involved in cell wall biosynthesis